MFQCHSSPRAAQNTSHAKDPDWQPRGDGEAASLRIIQHTQAALPFSFLSFYLNGVKHLHK